MNIDKLKECGKNIKMSEEMKADIIKECKTACETETTSEKELGFFSKKRNIAFAACALVAIGVGIACANFFYQPEVPVEPDEISTLIPIQTTASNTLEDSAVAQTQTLTTEQTEEGDTGCAEILPRKYRNNYYSIPASFADIVDEKAFDEWEDRYLAENYADDTNEMVMVAYIKEFNISKEDFERANLEYAYFMDDTYSHLCLDPQDYADQEFQEIYNTEIIYTFDNEIINAYYLGIDYPFLNEYQYVEALEAGTYKTRTTQFITIEQMEAEIYAKYGPAKAPEITE